MIELSVMIGDRNAANGFPEKIARSIFHLGNGLDDLGQRLTAHGGDVICYPAHHTAPDIASILA